MTVEEKLKELYKECEYKERTPGMIERGEAWIQSDGVLIAPEHIDLIANLVVERLKSIVP